MSPRILVAAVVVSPVLWGQAIPLDKAQARKDRNVRSETTSYRGRLALKVSDQAGDRDAVRLVLLPGTDLQDGAIEVEIAAEPGPGAAAEARGFAGIAFRLQGDGGNFECFYLRPTNGHADDQVRRNHSVQYIAEPDFPWYRLRKDFPERYESYVDLVPGEWTKVKIEVKGEKARLYVHDAAQPVLVVNDLKLGAAARGPIALWIGPGSVAHFADLRVTR
jgi:hypothetical protein